MSLYKDIRDHGMVLPDIADLPEFSGLDFFPNKSKKASSILREFDEAIEKRNQKRFRIALEKLNALTDTMFETSAVEAQIKEAQYANLIKMSKQYIADLIRKERAARTDIKSNIAYEDLCKQGFHATNLDLKSKLKIKNFLEKKIDALQGQPNSDHSSPGSGYDRHYVFKKNRENMYLFNILEKFYMKNLLYGAAEKYYSCVNLKIKAITLHVCSPGDTHYLQTLRDCETTSRLIGMHFDPKAVMKSIIYLNDVYESSGPFSVVPTSNRWVFDDIEFIFAKGSSTGNYLNSPEHRRVAAQFPKRLRKNAIFGRLIPDGTNLSDMLLQKEKKFLSSDTDLILFDPANTFHRGGICSKGQRVNLQVILSVK